MWKQLPLRGVTITQFQTISVAGKGNPWPMENSARIKEMTGRAHLAARWRQLESEIQTPTAGRKEAEPYTVGGLPTPSFFGAQGLILKQGSALHIQRFKVFRDKLTMYQLKKFFFNKEERHSKIGELAHLAFWMEPTEAQERAGTSPRPWDR